MTKHTLKHIDAQKYLGDMLIAKLDPLAELLMLRLEMMAVQAMGWLCAGTLAFTDDELARMGRVPPEDFPRLMEQLIAIGKIARDETRGAYYFPELVKAKELSETRSRVARRGGGNPALKRRAQAVQNGGQRDLFKQNAGNVIPIEKSNSYGRKRGAAPGINNIYNINKNNTGKDYYFAVGPIKLCKEKYLAWQEKFPFIDLFAELSNRAEWLMTQPADRQTNWWISTEHDLRNRNARNAPDWAREGGAA